MRKLLLLLLLPFTAGAQHVQIKAGAGINIANLERESNSTTTAAPAYTLKAGIAIKGWQLGAGVDITTYKANVTDRREGTFNPATGEQTQPSEIKYTLYYARPAIQPYLFVNRLINAGSHRLNIGLHGGAIIASTDQSFAGNYTPAYSGRTLEYSAGSGYIAGVQAGYMYSINRRVGVYAEVSPRFVSMRPKDETLAKVSGFTIPVTAGVSIQL